MPEWLVTVVTLLIGAVVGGLITFWLQVLNQRHQEKHARLMVVHQKRSEVYLELWILWNAAGELVGSAVASPKSPTTVTDAVKALDAFKTYFEKHHILTELKVQKALREGQLFLEDYLERPGQGEFNLDQKALKEATHDYKGFAYEKYAEIQVQLWKFWDIFDEPKFIFDVKD